MGRKKKIPLDNKVINQLDLLHLATTENINELVDQLQKPNLPNEKIMETNEIINEITNEMTNELNINVSQDLEKKKRGRKKKIQSNLETSPKNIDKLQSTNIFSKSSEKYDDSETFSDGKKDKKANKKNTGSDEGKNELFKELLVKQIKNICPSKKLQFNDVKRISKFLNETIFDEKKCSLWNGYITNEKNQSKGTYINFYFNKKKIALHRLLYINYIGDISNDEYIKFSCENKGKCCTISHMKKYTYYKSLDSQTPDNNSSSSSYGNPKNVHINTNKDKLVVEF